jgi:hypothetical protein
MVQSLLVTPLGQTVFGADLSSLGTPVPATARILVELKVGGKVHITSTLEDEKTTIDLLDKAMEAIDGPRLPVEDTRR